MHIPRTSLEKASRLSLFTTDGWTRVSFRIYLITILTLCLSPSLDWQLSLTVHQISEDNPKQLAWAHKLTKLGEFQYPGLLFLLIALISWPMNKKNLMRWAIASMCIIAIAGILVHIPKSFFQRLRPEAFYRHEESGFFSWGIGRPHDSFPSGHSTVAGALFLCLWLRLRQLPFILITWLACAFLAATRVLTNKHFATDCIAGYVFGGVMAATLWQLMFSNGYQIESQTEDTLN